MDIANNHITYIELKSNDLQKTKEFYSAVFKWSFKDYGPDYSSFAESGVAGGFEKSDLEIVNGVLIVLYHKDLHYIKDRISKSGGTITQEVYSFPGGQRFHFKDPSGNELAVWSDH